MWNIPMENFPSADTKLQNLLEKHVLGTKAALHAVLGGLEGMEGQVRTHVP